MLRAEPKAVPQLHYIAIQVDWKGLVLEPVGSRWAEAARKMLLEPWTLQLSRYAVPLRTSIPINNQQKFMGGFGMFFSTSHVHSISFSCAALTTMPHSRNEVTTSNSLSLRIPNDKLVVNRATYMLPDESLCLQPFGNRCFHTGPDIRLPSYNNGDADKEVV